MRTCPAPVIPFMAPRFTGVGSFPWHAQPANGALIRALRDRGVGDLNAIIRTVTRDLERVGAISRPLLELARSLPTVVGDPGRLAFALAGVIQFLAPADEPRRPGAVTLQTRRRGHRARLLISTRDLPPLKVIRALLSDAAEGSHRLLRSCIAVIRGAHGAVELLARRGGIALAIELPAVPDEDRAASSPPPPFRFPSPPHGTPLPSHRGPIAA